MEKQKDNKGIIILLIVIVIILAILCVIFATGIISFNSNNIENNSTNENHNDGIHENINDNNDNNDNDDNDEGVVDTDVELTDDEAEGLKLYKFFVDDGTGPFKWENNEVVNYDEVMLKMTNSYIKSFESEDNGFSIPFRENGEWKSYGGYGTDQESIFKQIKVVSKDACRIHYEVTYEYTKMGDTSQKVYEERDQFVVKTNSCDSTDLDVDFSKGYKMDSFKLIYGMAFK